MWSCLPETRSAMPACIDDILTTVATWPEITDQGVPIIDQFIRQSFSQGLTQAEISLSRGYIHISPCHLSRRKATTSQALFEQLLAEAERCYLVNLSSLVTVVRYMCVYWGRRQKRVEWVIAHEMKRENDCTCGGTGVSGEPSACWMLWSKSLAEPDVFFTHTVPVWRRAKGA